MVKVSINGVEVELTKNEAKEAARLALLVRDIKQPNLTQEERAQLVDSARRQAKNWTTLVATDNLADIERADRRTRVVRLLGLE